MTAGGYTLSSTYDRRQYNGHDNTTYAAPTGQNGAPRRAPQGQVQQYWYQSGNIRCTKPGCTFTGSKKAVETHMMDRHLIYPPGWESRKRKNDWDADPSLKGKPIPIQGTGIKLDTPEAIEAWIAERKKRFPTVTRVEEKEKKIEEAIARGQLGLEDTRFSRNKRRKLDHDVTQQSARTGRNERGRGRGAGCGRGRGEQGALTEAPVEGEGVPTRIPHPLPPLPSSLPSRPGRSLSKRESDASSGSESDSDSAPEVVSSKAPAPHIEQAIVESELDEEEKTTREPAVARSSRKQLVKKPPPRQPRRPPRNPFASRPSLLRNLLNPEIRMTISNLSQAIRFLVDNDFLEGVELKPGQANEKMIEVIGQTYAPASQSTSITEAVQR
ncbi:hypothetical protein CERSUDRAFT_41682 [Gelatoporia subvermispora B]|uniref:FMR1-interacting protein 1 conserved domain-containing protein n=1 Tax=Ceriporiopsis subvermispora (strain B) TaxID=914234 RepID=M2PZ75_CERS8|nr:hypothetical protein CERSUDRAFT_41682 [Gelatoporia subvermispora B]